MKQVRSPRMRYALEKHSHGNGLPVGPDSGLWFLRDDGEWVVPGGSGPENWLGDALVRTYAVHNDVDSSGVLVDQPYVVSLWGVQVPVVVPAQFDTPLNCHARVAGNQTLYPTGYPYSMTHGFYFRATFGTEGGAGDCLTGVGGASESRFMGVSFTGTSGEFYCTRDGTTSTSGSFTAVPGNVITLEIRTLPDDEVEFTLTDKNTEVVSSHIFNGLTDDGVPNSNRFGTASSPMCLRPYHIATGSAWSLVRWDSAEHTFAPWGNV